jgi:hypothetical protein
MNLIHTITSSNMSVKFDDNTTAHWNIAKKRELTYNNGIVLKISGMHSDSTTTGIAEWGTTRLNQPFTTAIINPVILRQDCNARVTEGQIRHKGFITATVTFGLDVNGAATACPAGTYYYKIIWTGPNGTSVTLIAPY